MFLGNNMQWYVGLPGLVVGERMTCSRAVLEDIFNEQEMMVLHRIDLEMVLADRLQRQTEERYESMTRDIIMLDDDDDVMDGPNVANDANTTPREEGTIEKKNILSGYKYV